MAEFEAVIANSLVMSDADILQNIQDRINTRQNTREILKKQSGLPLIYNNNELVEDGLFRPVEITSDGRCLSASIWYANLSNKERDTMTYDVIDTFVNGDITNIKNVKSGVNDLNEWIKTNLITQFTILQDVSKNIFQELLSQSNEQIKDITAYIGNTVIPEINGNGVEYMYEDATFGIGNVLSNVLKKNIYIVHKNSENTAYIATKNVGGDFQSDPTTNNNIYLILENGHFMPLIKLSPTREETIEAVELTDEPLTQVESIPATTSEAMKTDLSSHETSNTSEALETLATTIPEVEEKESEETPPVETTTLQVETTPNTSELMESMKSMETTPEVEKESEETPPVETPPVETTTTLNKTKDNKPRPHIPFDLDAFFATIPPTLVSPNSPRTNILQTLKNYIDNIEFCYRFLYFVRNNKNNQTDELKTIAKIIMEYYAPDDTNYFNFELKKIDLTNKTNKKIDDINIYTNKGGQILAEMLKDATPIGAVAVAPKKGGKRQKQRTLKKRKSKSKSKGITIKMH